ncbi:hypothetical protein GEU84_005040 [Fertoebacter nigrum]|uniref:Uncharacterized protein n=1 Tax=Fertoeibacter niger TaxID=2656921 RepID=A0A8X8H612_9RHOB|nr:hypothetical protein [Fertoeibacter niger]NUB43741.1 hypothetical protein [Fertoeibacter niger]
MAAPVIRRHGRYNLRAGKLGAAFTARAFLADAKAGSGIVAETTGPTAEAALEAMVALLTARDNDQRSQRRAHPDVDLVIPTSAEYADALAALPVTPGQRAMLAAHRVAGDAGLTATQIADAASYASFASANLHYGKLGRMIADYFSIALPKDSAGRADHVATNILAFSGAEQVNGHWLWIMHPELRAALAEGA